MTKTPTEKSELPRSVPGPHICNQVGNNVLGLVRALLSERCDANGGALAKADIARILDQLSSSAHLFPVFEAAYAGCDHTRKHFHGGAFSRETLPRFIVIALFRDCMQAAFHSTAQSFDPAWQSVFTSALIQYLE